MAATLRSFDFSPATNFIDREQNELPFALKAFEAELLNFAGSESSTIENGDGKLDALVSWLSHAGSFSDAQEAIPPPNGTFAFQQGTISMTSNVDDPADGWWQCKGQGGAAEEFQVPQNWEDNAEEASDNQGTEGSEQREDSGQQEQCNFSAREDVARAEVEGETFAAENKQYVSDEHQDEDEEEEERTGGMNPAAREEHEEGRARSDTRDSDGFTMQRPTVETLSLSEFPFPCATASIPSLGAPGQRMNAPSVLSEPSWMQGQGAGDASWVRGPWVNEPGEAGEVIDMPRLEACGEGGTWAGPGSSRFHGTVGAARTASTGQRSDSLCEASRLLRGCPSPFGSELARSSSLSSASTPPRPGDGFKLSQRHDELSAPSTPPFELVVTPQENGRYAGQNAYPNAFQGQAGSHTHGQQHPLTWSGHNSTNLELSRGPSHDHEMYGSVGSAPTHLQFFGNSRSNRAELLHWQQQMAMVNRTAAGGHPDLELQFKLEHNNQQHNGSRGYPTELVIPQLEPSHDGQPASAGAPTYFDDGSASRLAHGAHGQTQYANGIDGYANGIDGYARQPFHASSAPSRSNPAQPFAPNRHSPIGEAASLARQRPMAFHGPSHMQPTVPQHAARDARYAGNPRQNLATVTARQPALGPGRGRALVQGAVGSSREMVGASREVLGGREAQAPQQAQPFTARAGRGRWGCFPDQQDGFHAPKRPQISEQAAGTVGGVSPSKGAGAPASPATSESGRREEGEERGGRERGQDKQGKDGRSLVLNIEEVLSGEEKRRSVMIRNIPNKYSQRMLLAAVDTHFQGEYDFLYLPIDFKNKCNMGYAFINFIEPRTIAAFYKTFNGRKWDRFNSDKVCDLAYARIQGKQALINHFQNSSLMTEDKKWRPIIFHSSGPLRGTPQPFPVGSNVRPRPKSAHGDRSERDR